MKDTGMLGDRKKRGLYQKAKARSVEISKEVERKARLSPGSDAKKAKPKKKRVKKSGTQIKLDRVKPGRGLVPLKYQMNLSKLEQPKDVFYIRLTPPETAHVKSHIKEIKKYMASIDEKYYLIAGVGGVLRNQNHRKAKDIDLAVVGLKYAWGNHNFQDVEKFTKHAKGYFDNYCSSLNNQFESQLHGGSDWKPIGLGSGPMANLNTALEGEMAGRKVEVVSSLEDFGMWGSKGFQVNYEDSRPIDVQFLFNKSIEEWFIDQKKPRHAGFNKNNMKELYYSILYKNK
ncbi:hypothetical protein ACFLZZ_00670 [Nanoarchaeota archaeon]